MELPRAAIIHSETMDEFMEVAEFLKKNGVTWNNGIDITNHYEAESTYDTKALRLVDGYARRGDVSWYEENRLLKYKDIPDEWFMISGYDFLEKFGISVVSAKSEPLDLLNLL